MTVAIGATRRRRKAPNPQNSILDRTALIEALDENGIAIKPLHIDAFYQALHRQHYPPLKEFVATYYKHEALTGSMSSLQKKESDLDSRSSTTTSLIQMVHLSKNYHHHHHHDPRDPTNDVEQQQQQQQKQLPLRNPVSNKKNRNRVQLPKAFLEFLETTNDFVTISSKVKQQLTSKDSSTTKLVIELYDGQVVESVLMRYEQKGSGRASLCVSSQCGCAMGCTFCATGTMGLSGNLTSAEILEQLVHANAILGKDYANKTPKQKQQQQQQQQNAKKVDLVRNVVFMGMGEPLDNYSNVVEACRSMMDRKRWNLAHGRVTVSTVGLISQIRKLTRDLPQVSLALSLHAPNQTLRSSIVPTASRYPIEQLVDALDNHMMAYLKAKEHSGNYSKEERIKESTRRRAMIEYVMLEGETSSLESAHQLGKLCENRQLIVNLIPYNATDVKDKHQCPPEKHMQEFRDIVASYGSFCTIRRTMGADIASACGQLVSKDKQDQQNNNEPSLAATVDIEDAIPSNPKGNDGGIIKERRRGIANKAVSFNEKASSSSSSSTPFTTRLLNSIPSDQLDQLSQALAVASAVAVSCLVVASISVLRKRR